MRTRELSISQQILAGQSTLEDLLTAKQLLGINVRDYKIYSADIFTNYFDS